MSERWVVNQLFKLQAVGINWSDEAGALGYVGLFLDTGMDAGFMQFRWMLHPAPWWQPLHGRTRQSA